MLAVNTPIQSPQQSFQGRLLVDGVKLPKRKLAQVAQIFEEKTKGLPDATLIGKRRNSIDGTFYHTTNFIQQGNDFAAILTGEFKELFKKLSPKQIATGLANMSKAVAKEEQAIALEKEIQSLKIKRKNLIAQAEAMRNNGKNVKFAQFNEATSKRMNLRITKLEMELDKINKEAQKEIKCKGNWLF